MQKTITSLAVALILAVSGGIALAQQYKAGDMEVLHPWTRATPPNAQTAGGFLELHNEGSAEDALIGGHSSIAERVEFHTMTMKDGVMRMRPVGAEGVVVKPGETASLAPGGIHIMFIGLKHSLKVGERVPLTLDFRSGGSVDVELVTQALGSQKAQGAMKDTPMEHSH